MKPPRPVTRRLAAIAFADLAGFSAAVEADDASAVARWRNLRETLLVPAIARHRGMLRRVVGDALFVEFHSAVDAVSWAVETQAALHALADARTAPSAMRIGINVEDAIVDDDDLHGNGVNVAARIQALAAPGQIMVTSTVYEYVRNKLELDWVDAGLHELKNIAEPVQLYCLEGARAGLDPAAGAGASAGASAGAEAALQRRRSLALRRRPTSGAGVAVLPFRNLSGDPREDYFGEGITEDIIAGLARNRALVVIARHSTLSYRGPQLDVRRIARELGVRYLVGGSVRRQATALRIHADLNDVADNRILWSERYDGREEELFEFQDRIAAGVVATIDPRIHEAEARRVRSKPTGNLDAYDCVLKAFSLLYTLADVDFFEAGTYLDRAIELDGSFAQAHAHKAWWYVLLIGDAKRGNRRRDSQYAMACAQRALELDPDDAFVLAVAGHVTGFVAGRPADARELFDRALRLNPNSAFAWGVSASTLSFLGDTGEALRRLAEAEKRSPFDPMNFFYQTVRALALFVDGRSGEAVEHLRRVHETKPRFVAALRLYAACLALEGDGAQAHTVGAELLALDPTFSVAEFNSWYPLQRDADRQRLVQGLRAAGLPP